MRTPAMLAALLACSCSRPPAPDLVILNARVWTADTSQPRAEAVAITGERISFVGSSAEVARRKGRGTIVVDAGGKLLLPGFIDSHVHFVGGGFQLRSVDLRGAGSEEEFVARIRQRAEQSPGSWITGGDWDHDGWPGGSLPTRSLVDRYTPTTPVFVSRYDGHMALANSLVLSRAGITRATPDPPGGSIVRDPATGEPTGILKDEAMSLVWRLVPDPSDSEILEAARRALAEARRFGVTSVQDVSSRADLRAYRTLLAQGELTARLYCRLPLGPAEERATEGLRAGPGDPWIRTGCLKAFADGSLGSSTALFFDAYVSDPSTRGLPSDIALDGRLERWSRAADSAGRQLSIHAIGDSANSLVLGIFERIAGAVPRRDRRFRIEHAQHVRPDDFARFARLGVIASVQPYHAIDDGRWAEGRIGRQRCASTYAFRSFLDHGVRLAFGSDWTVAPLNPLLGIHAAVTRRTTDGRHPEGWYPEQKISVAEAVTAYTAGGAYAAFEEKEKGSIAPGMLADLVILSEDILQIDPGRIKDVAVEMTIVGGRVVFRR